MCSILLFAGTTEGRRMAAFLDRPDIRLTVSVATDYGRDSLRLSQRVEILVNRLEEGAMEELLRERGFDCVVDATHPYAAAVTRNIRTACCAVGVRYLRLLRPLGNGWEGLAAGELAAPDIQQAARFLSGQEGNILLTTGSKELDVFTCIPNYRERVYPRVLPSVSVMEKCYQLGFTGKTILAMQGPFSRELNMALLRHTNAAWMVTKASGEVGGFSEKVGAALELGVKVLIVTPPEQGNGLDFYACCKQLKEWYQL